MPTDAGLSVPLSNTTPSAPLRCFKERVLQTLLYEAGGLLIVTPLYAVVVRAAVGESLALLFAVSVACMAWAAIHNTLFDWVEARTCKRVASDRPASCRVLHAISHETTSIIVTTPVIMWMAGFGFWEALATDIGITLAYAAYAYVFHWLFDRMRPVEVVVRKEHG